MSNGGLQPYRTMVMTALQLPDNSRSSYKNVVTQIYPLRASLDSLNVFCDNYLNYDDERDPCPAMFKAAAPWVLMQVADYGEMGADQSGARFFSQHELAFGFPVEWYDLVNGNYTFREYAMVYPFIYVDNPLSMGGGREIYGWAKSSVQINCNLPDLDPHDPRLVASIGRRKYRSANEPPPWIASKLLEAQRQAATSHPKLVRTIKSGTFQRSLAAAFKSGTFHAAPLFATQTGPDSQAVVVEFLNVSQSRPFPSGRSGWSVAIDSAPRAMRSYFNALSGMFGTMATFAAVQGESFMPPYRNSSLNSLFDVILRWYGYINRMSPAIVDSFLGYQGTRRNYDETPSMRIVTLKQFRDAADNANACYRAIVGSALNIENAKDGGLLFDVLSADVSGGIEIRIRHEAQDVMEQLGIQPTSGCVIGGEAGHSVRPVLPFWAKVDLSYGPADIEFWRTKDTFWSTDYTPRYGPPSGSGNAKRPPLKYVTYGSGAGDELQGPFGYDDLTARFLLFTPNDKKVNLKGLISKYLENDFYEFDLPADGKTRLWFVIANFYLNASRMVTGTYQDRQLAVIVPMQWRKKGETAWKPVMIPICSFVGADWDFITEREVYGRVTVKSTVASPPNMWIKMSDPSEKTDVLTISTVLFPDDETQPASELPLFDIQSVPESDEAAPSKLLDKLGLSPFLDVNFYVVSLKQIIDARNLACAAYQSLVGVKRALTVVGDPGKIGPLSLQIFPYKCLPLLDELGLAGNIGGKTGTISTPDAVLVKGSMKDIGQGVDLCWRAGSGSWQMGTRPS